VSNKKLAYILIVVVLASAGGFLLWRLGQSNQTEIKETEQNMSQGQTQQQDQQTKQNNPDQTACQRAFDSEKLKSEKVEIKDRQAEISVKGFGKITVEFFDQDAPKTVENFLRLANSGYFDCVTFHRVAKGFVIQGGDPTGTGAGGESAFGGEFADELNPDAPSYKEGYKKGVLAMANSGPNTNSSQFFIMLDDVPLQHGYTIFGKVVSGQDTVDKIGQVDIVPQMGPNDGAPKVPVVIKSAKIIK
jgi:cyclophilin family peptidyl-prolyl cis-trans isomerase